MSKKRNKLIDIIVNIPNETMFRMSKARCESYDSNQIIATNLVGALIEVSQGTQYKDLVEELIQKCIDIDCDDIIDTVLLGMKRK